MFQLMGGLRSGMGYCGAASIEELKENGRFIRISAASLRESHPHDIHITKKRLITAWMNKTISVI